MGTSIQSELLLFLRFFLMGFLIHGAYDLIRTIISFLPYRRFIKNAADFFFWIFLTETITEQVQEHNQGLFRSYLFLAMLSGIMIWNGIFSRKIRKICTRLLHFPFFLVEILINRLFFWWKRCKIFACTFVKKRL